MKFLKLMSIFTLAFTATFIFPAGEGHHENNNIVPQNPRRRGGIQLQDDFFVNIGLAAEANLANPIARFIRREQQTPRCPKNPTQHDHTRSE